MLNGGKRMKIKIEEGKTYLFKIAGSVVSPDGQDYFILIDLNNIKHLLGKKYYSKYKFEIGQTINCRIDKINCNGKIYLEPEHPYYKQGNKYEFFFQKTKKILNSAGEKEKIALLTDVFNNKIEMPFEDLHHELKPGEKLKYKVKKIKKGIIYISVTDKDDYSGLKVNEKYSFKISHTKTYAGKYDYFVLIDPNGCKYKIRKKFYDKYNLEPGKTVVCRLIKDGKRKYLEPMHPFYIIGEEYDFEIIREGYRNVYPDEKKAVYILKNNYGKEILLNKEDISPAKIKQRKIKCKVSDIRKGQVYLD